jgi:O-antigen/teichoic acid export membrane protein
MIKTEEPSLQRHNLFDLKLFDTLRTLLSKDGDRGTVRLRRAGFSGVTAVLAQGLGIAANLVSVPLTVKYLGPERYGVWLTMGTAFAWLGITDLGFGGNALVNVLAEADGKDDLDAARGLVATAFWSLVVIATVVVLAFGCAFTFVSWTSVFNVSSSIAAHELRVCLALQAAIFLFMLPLGIVNATYRAYQEGYIANLWEMTASIGALIAVIVVTSIKGGLPKLALALSGTRLLVTIVSFVYLFCRRYPWLLPKPSLIRRDLFRRLISLGLKYVVNQLAVMVSFQSQPMIITRVLGPGQVGAFTIAQRLLSLPATIIYLLMFPLLSAYSEAKARRDWDWIWHTLERCMTGSLAFAAILVAIIGVAAQPLVRLWVGPALVPTTGLVIALGVNAMIAAVATPSGILLYGLEQVGGLSIIQSVQAAVTLFLCIRFAQSWGLTGVAIAMSVSFVTTNWVGQAIQLRRILRAHRQPQEAVQAA